jgi:hypothetical protein
MTDNIVTSKPETINKIFLIGKAASFGKPRKGINAIKIPNENIVEIFIMELY